MVPLLEVCFVETPSAYARCLDSIQRLTQLGETIPIRLFLGGFDLTPTFREVNKKYSTRYYLSLVLIDEGRFESYLQIY